MRLLFAFFFFLALARSVTSAPSSSPRIFGLYTSYQGNSCEDYTYAQNNTLYFNRCNFYPQLGSSEISVPNLSNSSYSQLMYMNEETCGGDVPEVTVIALEKCLGGPFPGEFVMYHASQTPYEPPAGPTGLYGQTVTCPTADCNNVDCNYDWFEPDACIPGPFGSRMNSRSGDYLLLKQYGSTDCSDVPSIDKVPLNICTATPMGGYISYYCDSTPPPPPGYTHDYS